MIRITDSARDKIKEILSANPGKYLRVMYKGMGWNGPNIGLALEEPKENEKTIQVNGIDLLIIDDLKPYTEHSTIDYVDVPGRSGLTIRS